MGNNWKQNSVGVLHTLKIRFNHDNELAMISEEEMHY